MREINRKFLVIAVALLCLAVLATPVLAKRAEKVSFTAEQTPNVVQPPPAEDARSWVTPGDTAHYRNLLGAGTIVLTIDGQEPISGTTSAVIDVNVRVAEGGHIKFLMTWTFDGGTFVGNINGHSITPSTVDSLHGVLMGTGAYSGWKVMIEEGYKLVPGPTPFHWSGTILMP